MKARIDIGLSLKYALIEAVLFAATVFIYVKYATYQKTWLLFLGSFMFLIVNALYSYIINRLRSAADTPFTLIVKSHIVTVSGIILSCILSFLIMTIMIKGYTAGDVLNQPLPGDPPTMESNKITSLSIKIFLVAVIGNFIAGSFPGLLIPFFLDRQKQEEQPNMSTK